MNFALEKRNQLNESATGEDNQNVEDRTDGRTSEAERTISIILYLCKTEMLTKSTISILYYAPLRVSLIYSILSNKYN